MYLRLEKGASYSLIVETDQLISQLINRDDFWHFDIMAIGWFLSSWGRFKKIANRPNKQICVWPRRCWMLLMRTLLLYIYIMQWSHFLQFTCYTWYYLIYLFVILIFNLILDRKVHLLETRQRRCTFWFSNMCLCLHLFLKMWSN